MSWKDHIIWHIYLILLSLFIWEKALLFFQTGSGSHLYYQLLFYFDPLYFAAYFLEFLQNISNFVLIFAVILFVHQKRVTDPIVWQTFLCVKILLDMFGHNYGWNYVAGFYQMDVKMGWWALLFYAAIYIPGYIALALYACTPNSKNH